MQYVKVAVVAACASSVINIGITYTSFAQQSQLQQQIEPFECIYTTIQTGEGSSMDSTCDGQPVPLLTSVEGNNGRPLLRGSFNVSRSLMLRVWINGQWYTLGIDPRLTVADGGWQLDLSELSTPLQAGIYTVMVEVETSDGLLLRNTSAGLFIVPVTPLSSLPVQHRAPSDLSYPGFFTPTILPRTQEGAQMPGTVQVPRLPAITSGNERDRNSEPAGVLQQAVYTAITLAAIVGAGWGIWYFWRRLG